MSESPAGLRSSVPLVLRARAKINLRLEVRRRRADGFHEIRTLMHSLDLADSVEIRATPPHLREPAAAAWPAGSVCVECVPRGDLRGPANLAHRASALYLQTWAERSDAARQVGVETLVHKRIPVAAGLGGGSADAAAALRGLSVLFGRQGGPSGEGPLNSIARRLGSDVPFCLFGGAAWGEGRGDELRPVDSVLRCPVLIAMPCAEVSSPAAYAWWDAAACGAEPEGALPGAGLPVVAGSSQRQEGGARPPYMLEALSVLPKLVRNDLRPVVAKRLPVVDELIRAMRDDGAVASEMSGSGPAVFGVFAESGRALAARDRLAAKFRAVTWIPTSLDPRREAISGRD